ncbi:MAG: glycosyltransferase [Planctomycetes bacterium]|nr:glycosyltransferase [Planctomycetota bacterium]
MRLRLWIVTDALQPPARGNGTTVARWIDGLRSRGHELAILEPGHTARSSWAPDVVLGYHAERCGPAAVALAAHCGAASAIALGGTDLLALEDGSGRAGQGAIRRCDLVVGAFPSFGERLAALELGSPAYAVVRRGVFRDPDPPLPRDPRRLEIALPSGLRRVKDPLFAIARFAALRAAGIDARLRIVGAALEDDLARAVIDAARALPGIEIGQRPPVAMGALYARAHVVWNSSLHEGGANAVLEAAALGCAVLLRDVPGNRELAAESGSPVALFRDDATSVAFHRALLCESAADRDARHAANAAWLARWHDPADEIEDLERALHAAVAGRGGGPRSP